MLLSFSSCGRRPENIVLSAELPQNHEIFVAEEYPCKFTYHHCRNSWLTREFNQNGTPLPSGRLLVFSWHPRDYPGTKLPHGESWLKQNLLPELKEVFRSEPELRLHVSGSVLEAGGISAQGKKLLLRYHLRTYDNATLHYVFIWPDDNYSEVLKLEEQTLRSLKPKFTAEIEHAEDTQDL